MEKLINAESLKDRVSEYTLNKDEGRYGKRNRNTNKKIVSNWQLN